MRIFIGKQVKGRRLPVCYTSDGRADRFANLQPKKVLLPLGFEGSIKEKGYVKGFFTMDDKKQEMKDKKQKYAYWMRPSLVDEMTEMLESANATSKSDFVCQAVEFYIGYLRQQKNIDYLSPILAGVIRDEIESVEKNVCEMLFRLAVEQAKLCHAVAANSHYSEETMQLLHDECAHEVSNCNGIIIFEEAYRYQKS